MHCRSHIDAHAVTFTNILLARLDMDIKTQQLKLILLEVVC